MTLLDCLERSLVNQLDTYVYVVSNYRLLDFLSSDQNVLDQTLSVQG